MRLEKRRPRLVRWLDRRRQRAAAQTDTPQKQAESRGAGDPERDPGEAARDASIRGAAQSAPLNW